MKTEAEHDAERQNLPGSAARIYCAAGFHLRSDVSGCTETRRLLRPDAPPHKLVARCLHHWQPPDRPRGCLQVRHGAADQASRGLHGSTQAAAGLPGRHRPFRICRHDEACKRPEQSDQQAPHRRQAQGQQSGRCQHRVQVPGHKSRQTAADRGPSEAGSGGQRLEGERRYRRQVL